MGLDVVELVIAVEQSFGIAIPDAAAAGMITPAHLISYVQKVVGSASGPGGCLSLAAFHHIRTSLMKTLGVSRTAITLGTRISTLFPAPHRPALWNAFRQQAALTGLPDLRYSRGWFSPPTTIKDWLGIVLLHKAHDPGKARSWTDGEVRQVIRQIIRDQLGIDRFRDTDEFVRDLGLD